jgi:hypothetical protein
MSREDVVARTRPGLRQDPQDDRASPKKAFLDGMSRAASTVSVVVGRSWWPGRGDRQRDDLSRPPTMDDRHCWCASTISARWLKQYSKTVCFA